MLDKPPVPKRSERRRSLFGESRPKVIAPPPLPTPSSSQLCMMMVKPSVHVATRSMEMGQGGASDVAPLKVGKRASSGSAYRTSAAIVAGTSFDMISSPTISGDAINMHDITPAEPVPHRASPNSPPHLRQSLASRWSGSSFQTPPTPPLASTSSSAASDCSQSSRSSLRSSSPFKSPPCDLFSTSHKDDRAQPPTHVHSLRSNHLDFHVDATTRLRETTTQLSSPKPFRAERMWESLQLLMEQVSSDLTLVSSNNTSAPHRRSDSPYEPTSRSSSASSYSSTSSFVATPTCTDIPDFFSREVKKVAPERSFQRGCREQSREIDRLRCELQRIRVEMEGLRLENRELKQRWERV
ncbi:hypothetical protein PHSY_000415 [Pseudozyma hubeiensis SY62]|uniref:Uncharacterized protein n=1 Tax=Pseudozyma hubeiensis (strain SY62) TaxID=1305764 RepID=R9NWB9_PSEHS|nr:hypothetical protein PHSY_000415 [Pseudozyma hubeiensis SY62]GAC92858.1 hypothetical protein PHSY_000415 [Pseudozyma hubeiensis SY62]